MKSDTFHYKLKTVIGDTFTDNSGRIARKFYRYIYDTMYHEYKIKDVWSTLIHENKAELVEENQRVIKLVFSPTSEKEWNINAFNIDESLMANYENIHNEFETNGFKFKKTIKVVQQMSEAPVIQIKNKYEIYAQGVGLINKYFKDITFELFDTLHPTNGSELYYKLINYGN